jgi:ankyrin repeat protein
LIQNGLAKVDNRNNWQRTPLILAAMCEQPKAVALLIKYGADVNAKDKDGITAVLHAAFKGNVDIMRSLVNAGATLDATGLGGFERAANSDPEVARYLEKIKNTRNLAELIAAPRNQPNILERVVQGKQPVGRPKDTLPTDMTRLVSEFLGGRTRSRRNRRKQTKRRRCKSTTSSKRR